MGPLEESSSGDDRDDHQRPRAIVGYLGDLIPGTRIEVITLDGNPIGPRYGVPAEFELEHPTTVDNLSRAISRSMACGLRIPGRLISLYWSMPSEDSARVTVALTPMREEDHFLDDFDSRCLVCETPDHHTEACDLCGVSACQHCLVAGRRGEFVCFICLRTGEAPEVGEITDLIDRMRASLLIPSSTNSEASGDAAAVSDDETSFLTADDETSFLTADDETCFLTADRLHLAGACALAAGRPTSQGTVAIDAGFPAGLASRQDPSARPLRPRVRLRNRLMTSAEIEAYSSQKDPPDLSQGSLDHSQLPSRPYGSPA